MLKLLWPQVLAGAALGLDAYVLAGLLPAMARDFTTSQATVGLGVALFTAAYAISAPMLAGAVSTLSTKVALLLGLGIFTAGNLMSMIAPSIGVLLASRLLAGVGAGLYSPLAATSAAGMVESGQRGRALAWVLAGLSVGTALGVPIGLFVEAHLGWRYTMGVIVCLGLISGMGIAVGNATFPASAPMPLSERVRALTNPFTRLTLLVTLIAGMASLGLYTYLAELFASRGMSGEVSTFLWLWGMGGMFGAFSIGHVIDRCLPASVATLILLLIMSLGFLLVGYGPDSIWVGAGCLVWGMAGWACMATQQHALVTHAGPKATAAVAWNSSANYLGSAIGAALGSLLLSEHMLVAWLPMLAVAAAGLATLIHVSKCR